MIDTLLSKLKELNYDIFPYDEHIESTYRITNNDLVIVIYNNKIYVDHKIYFDKLSYCPVQLDLPKNDNELKFLLDMLDWVRSSDGQTVSLNYEYGHFVSQYFE